MSKLPPAGATHKPGVKCLHCYLRAAIQQYFRDTGQVDASGEVLWDERYVLGNLAQVLAETIAAVPNRQWRREREKVFAKVLHERIAEATPMRLQ